MLSMMKSNKKLIIAAAGSGKTTYLINEALKNNQDNILITTYTQANKEEIINKFIQINKYIPRNITIQTWFSFLIQHGVKPFQGQMGLFDFDYKGLLKFNTKSAKYIKETDTVNYYFSDDQRIYSDKLSKFVVRSNEKGSGNVLNRIARIYDCIYIDEVQDLAGYDLDLLKLLFRTQLSILLACDPRQVTYLTHNESRYKKYRDGKIVEFIKTECKKIFPHENIDETTLKYSHRNNLAICEFASKLYPDYPKSMPCTCVSCRDNDTHTNQGVYLIRKKDVVKYLKEFNPVQLRWDSRINIQDDYPVYNFGLSKGLEFSRVLVYPPKAFIDWLKGDDSKLKPISKAKFYVAITRAKYSVGIIYDGNTTFSGIKHWGEE